MQTTLERVRDPLGFRFDPSCVLYLPLYDGRCEGSAFMSRDHYGHLCTVTGALWRLKGRWFDNFDDKITVPDNPCFNLATELTAIAVIKTDSLINNGQIVTRDNPTGNNREWSISLRSQKLQIDFGDPADGTWEGKTTTDNNVVTSASEFYCVAITYNRGTVVIDVNGEIVPSTNTTVPATLYTAATVDTLVGLLGNATEPYAGLIPEVALLNRALPFPTRQNIYRATKWRYQ